MRRTRFSRWPCSIARTVDILGDRWAPLLLREAFYGASRFEAFQQTLGISRNLLTQRLARFVHEGLMERSLYCENPPRFDYSLTDKGRDLFGVLVAMSAWGDRWLDAGRGQPIVMRHLSCGHDTVALVACDQCGEPLRNEEVQVRLGPGYPERLREFAQRSGRFTLPEETPL